MLNTSGPIILAQPFKVCLFLFILCHEVGLVFLPKLSYQPSGIFSIEMIEYNLVDQGVIIVGVDVHGLIEGRFGLHHHALSQKGADLAVEQQGGTLALVRQLLEGKVGVFRFFTTLKQSNNITSKLLQWCAGHSDSVHVNPTPPISFSFLN